MPFSAFNTPFLKTGKGPPNLRYLGYDIHIDVDKFAEKGIYDLFETYHDQYPSWAPNSEVPITRIEIQAIFAQLKAVFGFQEDNMKNMYDYLMRLLDSRSSRMGPAQALKTLHSDYIGGVNSNFKKWYFASQMDIDDTIGFLNASSNGEPKKQFLKEQGILSSTILPVEEAERRWSQNMSCLSELDCVVQIGLYLLIWGESNNIRFLPECICFIFKCCNDYFYSIDFHEPTFQATEKPFLEHVIDPLYKFYFEQSFESINGEVRPRDKDHSSIIGYDDMNQLFWYRKGLERIQLLSKIPLMNIPAIERYQCFDQIAWNKAFYKTYHETRTWLHLLTDFNRIWIIHFSLFWIYTALNSPTIYTQSYRQILNNQPTLQAKLSAISLAGPLTIVINICALLAQYIFVPRKWPGAEPLIFKLVILLLLLVITVAPSIYLLVLGNLGDTSTFGLTLSVAQLIVSLICVIYFSTVPLCSLFGGSYLLKHGRKYLASRYFTASIPGLRGRNLLASYLLWALVFSAKFVESYFFVTASLHHPIRELSTMGFKRCVGERYIGATLCGNESLILLFLMVMTDLAMFFLDTYLWYIIWNTLFSVLRSFHIGASIWTPWRNIFSRLPKRIFTKIVSSQADRAIKSKVLVSVIWNSVIISMYREHLISLEITEKLIYQEVVSTDKKQLILKEPNYFISQEDVFSKLSVFESEPGALRRITFFAQSLSTPMPGATPTESMPAFTVLVPHYGEKIMLSLKEIIREEDDYSHVTLLEYLKQLHSEEWNNFVQDTKLLAQEINSENSKDPLSLSASNYEDLAYYCVGFKSSDPEYILRTRIWASLRSQTLYRTISGFMNYSRAIKLLYDVENRKIDDTERDKGPRIEEAAMMALRKFRIVLSMQRFNLFSPRELEDTEFILRTYPEVQVAYLESEETENGIISYSCLIDGSCDILENGMRRPKYRIKLSGNPILGDGKSDNQNHALIFCRGEYIQLVDANQDNYLEECLKIRNLLAEFEETVPPIDSINKHESNENYENPVAIVGAREYIFSENIGVLGDVAAAKEQIFGTLFARTMAQIGGKLHYGHPDFLNAIFMTTRGGVSKAQKGLHLNEDVYAGMNALLRGGRIKHCEYVQCGKGRDLGFSSILNFTTKIGAGMGEQSLSREYFYIGTQLPIDRFLSIYYAHLGFHLNNVFIVLSIKLFLLTCIHLAALTHNSTFCEYDKNRPVTDPRRPSGCSNLMPVVEWLKHCIISNSLVFLISFVPLCVQEMTEKGVWRALTRVLKHFGSFSPVFEVFVCKIYAQSMISDLEIGGAKYIATGRGFATTRVPFVSLYSRFSSESLYFGGVSVCMLLFCSMYMWHLLILCLWYTIIALCLSPFLFNPNQFLWSEFFLDYRKFLVWFSSGNWRSSLTDWASFRRNHRSQFTGSKKKRGRKNGIENKSFKKPSTINLLFADILPHLLWTTVVTIAFLFLNSQYETSNREHGNSILRLITISFLPIVFNACIVLILFIVSAAIGPILTLLIKRFPALMAIISHSLCFISHLISFELMFIAQNYDYASTILGLCNTALIQGLFFKIVIDLFLTREIRDDASNKAWWSGKWINSGFGWAIFTAPIREYICKVIEMSFFTADFILGHILLFAQIPFVIFPYIDQVHSLVLLWLKPNKQFRPRILGRRERKRRRVAIHLSSFLFFFTFILFVLFLLAPYVISEVLEIDLIDFLPDIFSEIVQPRGLFNGNKGLAAYQRTQRRGH